MEEIKELKELMTRNALSNEKVSRILDCSMMSLHRWLKYGTTPNRISANKIKQGLVKLRELYPTTTYDYMMKGKSLYRKIKRRISLDEKNALFEINQTKGTKAYILALEKLVHKYSE